MPPLPAILNERLSISDVTSARWCYQLKSAYDASSLSDACGLFYMIKCGQGHPSGEVCEGEYAGMVGLNPCEYHAADAAGASGLTDLKGASSCAKKVEKNDGAWCSTKTNYLKCERSCEAKEAGEDIAGTCSASGGGAVIYVEEGASAYGCVDTAVFEGKSSTYCTKRAKKGKCSKKKVSVLCKNTCGVC